MGSAKEGSGYALSWIGWSFLGLVVAAIAVAVLWPVTTDQGPTSSKAQTIYNFRLIGIALQMYAADNDDYLPHEFSTNADLRSKLKDYIMYETAFETLNPAGGEILPNANLAGLNVATLALQDETVTLYETKAWEQGGKIFGFVDSHAKLVSDPSSVRMMPAFRALPSLEMQEREKAPDQ